MASENAKPAGTPLAGGTVKKRSACILTSRARKQAVVPVSRPTAPSRSRLVNAALRAARVSKRSVMRPQPPQDALHAGRRTRLRHRQHFIVEIESRRPRLVIAHVPAVR